MPPRERFAPPPVTKVDLTVGALVEALSTAVDRERPAVLAAVAPDGTPRVSFRGSIYVYSPDQLALWARKRDDGLVTYLAENPNVNILYYDPAQAPDPSVGPRRVQITGRARVDESANDAVWAGIPAVERDRAKDRSLGVAIIIEVDTVNGFGGGGPFKQAR